MKIIINIDNKKRASAKSWTINKTKVAQIDEKSAVWCYCNFQTGTDAMVVKFGIFGFDQGKIPYIRSW